MSATQPEGAIISVGSGTVSDAVLAPDGDTLYVARNGTITAYATATGEFVDSWAIGKQLGGIDISADGKYLVATERTPGPTTFGPNSYWWENRTDVYVYRLNLQTGVSTKFTAVAEGADGAFHDASFLADGTVLLTKTYNGSGWVPLTTLDFASGKFTSDPQAFAQDGTLTATPDKSHVAFLPSNISDAPVFIYTAGSGITASHQGYEDGVMGYNWGVQAISADGSLIVQGVGHNVYDGDLDFQLSLADKYRFLSANGFAFSPDGETLYMLEIHSRQVIAFDTDDWTVTGGYAIGSPITAGGYFGNGLQISNDGTLLAAIGEVSVQIIDLTLAVSEGPTSGDDTLTGDSSENRIFGFQGDDTIDGGGGYDTLYGGEGDDTYLINDNSGDTIVELPDEGFDTVIAAYNYMLSPDVEKLVLVGAAITAVGNYQANILVGNAEGNNLIGNEGDDTLIGNEGDDFLDGGAGNDHMSGGLGNDLYYVDSPADIIVELTGEGQDIVHSTVTYTLPDHVEALYLGAFSESISGTGNDGNNTIVGNDGDNQLNGGAGDDALAGGLGNDRLRGGAGNDNLNGGGGNDIALYSGKRSDFLITRVGQGFRLADQRPTNDEGTDFALGIETFRFSDGDVSAADLRASLPAAGNDWRLFTSDGFIGGAGGAGTIFGTSFHQDITVIEGSGAITFDPSFNRPGDVIRLHGAADDWTIARNGSSALLMSGDMVVSIPVGTGNGIAVAFDDGLRTLRFDVTHQAFAIGQQIFGDAIVPITAAPDGTAEPIGGAPNAIARLFMAESASVDLTGNVTVLGTAGQERIVLHEGTFRFDPSFNKGGDTIVLDLDAGDFTASRSGSSILLESDTVELLIPVGTSGTTLAFADGDRTLLFDAGLGSIVVGNQQIGLAAAALTDFA